MRVSALLFFPLTLLDTLSSVLGFSLTGEGSFSLSFPPKRPLKGVKNEPCVEVETLIGGGRAFDDFFSSSEGVVAGSSSPLTDLTSVGIGGAVGGAV
jgi:hypothetical protein